MSVDSIAAFLQWSGATVARPYLISGQGRADEIALDGLAAVVAQMACLRRGFDAFCKHFDAETDAELQHAVDQSCVALVGGQFGNKAAVDLELVDWKPPQVGE